MNRICILEFMSTDLLREIVNFLNNKDIIKLLCVNKYIYSSLNNKGNLYKSIVIKYDVKDLFLLFKNYLKHKDSIKDITFYGMEINNKNSTPDIWPFEIDFKIIHYISCKYFN